MRRLGRPAVKEMQAAAAAIFAGAIFAARRQRATGHAATDATTSGRDAIIRLRRSLPTKEADLLDAIHWPCRHGFVAISPACRRGRDFSRLEYSGRPTTRMTPAARGMIAAGHHIR